MTRSKIWMALVLVGAAFELSQPDRGVGEEEAEVPQEAEVLPGTDRHPVIDPLHDDLPHEGGPEEEVTTGTEVEAAREDVTEL